MGKKGGILLFVLLLLFSCFATVHAQEMRVAIIFNSTQQKDQFLSQLDNATLTSAADANTAAVKINDSLSTNDTTAGNDTSLNETNVSAAGAITTLSITMDNAAINNTAIENNTQGNTSPDTSNIVQNFGNLPIVTLDVTPQENDTLKTLAPSAIVAQIGVKHLLLQTSVPLINATATWQTLGYNSTTVNGINLTGKGQTACVIDTGINNAHPAFANKTITEACFCTAHPGSRNSNCCPNGQGSQTGTGAAADTNGHGTHVSGIIAAKGPINGVAPDANLAVVKVFGPDDVAYDDDILNAISYCTTNAAQLNISVISMSLGGSASTGLCPSDTLASAISAAIAKNISVVVATGNDGYVNAISSPACVPGVTRVAASNKDDTIASYSDTNSYVQIVAPGTSINSTYGSGYAILSGTSMATPHVSGSILLLRQALSIANVQQNTSLIESALVMAGKVISDATRGQSFARIDIFDALKQFESFFTPIITDYNTTHPYPGENATVTITANPGIGTETISQVTVLTSTNNSYAATYNSSTKNWTAIVQNATTLATLLVVDSRNNTVNKTINIALDVTPPQTQLILQLRNGSFITNTSKWYNQSITISANATDDLNVIAWTQVQLGANATWQNITTNVTLNTSTPDTYIFYKSQDAAGNNESANNISLLIDEDAPQINPQSVPQSTPSNATIIMSTLAQDNLSGIANVTISIIDKNANTINSALLNNSFASIYNGTIAAPNTSGNYTIVLAATDLAGNTNSTSSLLVVDPAAIAVSAKYANGSVILNTTQLIFNISQAVNGTVSIENASTYNITNATSITLNNTLWLANMTVNISLNLTGQYTALNCTYNYTIDQPPILNSVSVNNSDGLILVTANISNFTSISAMTATIGNHTLETGTQPYNITFDSLDFVDANYTIIVNITDALGLFANATAPVTVSNSNPVTLNVTNNTISFTGTQYAVALRQIDGLNSSNVTVYVRRPTVVNDTLLSAAVAGSHTELLALDINASTDNSSQITISIPTAQIVNSSYLRYWINHTNGNVSTLSGPFTPGNISLSGSYYDMILSTTNFSTFIVAQTYPTCAANSAVTSSCSCGSTIVSGGYCCNNNPSASTCSIAGGSSGGGGGSSGSSHGGGSSGGFVGAPASVTTTNTTVANATSNASNGTPQTLLNVTNTSRLTGNPSKSTDMPPVSNQTRLNTSSNSPQQSRLSIPTIDVQFISEVVGSVALVGIVIWLLMSK